MASKAIRATAVAPNLLSYALSALNDSSKAATHDENEELTLGRVCIPLHDFRNMHMHVVKLAFTRLLTEGTLTQSVTQPTFNTTRSSSSAEFYLTCQTPVMAVGAFRVPHKHGPGIRACSW